MSAALQIRLVSAIVIAFWLQAPARGANVPEAPVSQPDTASATRVLVLPFESLSGGPTGDAAAVAGLARSLADDLSAAPSVTCSQGDKVAADAAAAMELGRADGAQFVVWGTTQVIADRVRVAAQVLDVGSGKAVGRVKLTGTIDGWFELQEAVAER